MKKTVLAAAALTAVVCAVAAFSQGGQPGPGGQGGPGGRMGVGGMRGVPGAACPAMALLVPRSNIIDPLTKEADLTDDQVTQLKALLAKSDEAAPALQKKAGDASKALREALVAETFDAAKVKELAAAAQKAEDAIISANIEEWTQIRSILNAEQAKKLTQLMNPMQGRMGRPGGARPGDGANPPAGGENPPADGSVPPPPAPTE